MVGHGYDFLIEHMLGITVIIIWLVFVADIICALIIYWPILGHYSPVTATGQ